MGQSDVTGKKRGTYKKYIHNFGVNSHLVLTKVRPVGAYASMCELHLLVGKSVCYGCAFGGSNRFAETKRVGFYRFPALSKGRRRKRSR